VTDRDVAGCDLPASGEPTDRRLHGERGAGLVVGITLIFAFTFLGIVWLARDVDRAVSNRSAAQAIAFQSARSGAQAVLVPALRDGSAPSIDAEAARSAASSTAAQLFASYGVAGRVNSIDVGADDVHVTLTIDDGGRTVSGSATVRAERAP
jgi:Tfp pilus assembly protein PilX